MDLETKAHFHEQAVRARLVLECLTNQRNWSDLHGALRSLHYGVEGVLMPQAEMAGRARLLRPAALAEIEQTWEQLLTIGRTLRELLAADDHFVPVAFVRTQDGNVPPFLAELALAALAASER